MVGREKLRSTGPDARGALQQNMCDGLERHLLASSHICNRSIKSRSWPHTQPLGDCRTWPQHSQVQVLGLGEVATLFPISKTQQIPPSRPHPGHPQQLQAVTAAKAHNPPSLKGDHSTQGTHGCPVPWKDRDRCRRSQHDTPGRSSQGLWTEMERWGRGEPKQQEGHQGQGGDPPADTRDYVEEFTEGEAFQRGFV